MDANDIKDAKKLSVFLSIIGGSTYTLLRDLVAPQSPRDLSLDDAIKALKAHFEPKPIVIAERYHFHRRSQLPGESVADFVANLRKLSKHCAFGAFLEDALRDRLVCGLRSESMQKKLLSVKDLTFHDALETAQAMESAAQNSRSLQQPPSNASSVPVNKVHTGTSRKSPQPRFPPCSRCGRLGVW
jgi:hypothetical protein